MGVPQGLDEHLQQEIENQTRKELELLTSEEQQQYFDWISGRVIDPPEVVRTMTVNIAHKINITTGYLTAINLTRMNRIEEFLKRAEEVIFNPERVAELTAEELLKLYTPAQNILSSTLENTRRFISQTKDLNDTTEADELYKIIQTLPPNVVRRIRTIIEKENTGQEDVIESE